NVQPGRQGHSLLVQHSYYDTDPEIVDFRFSHLSVTDGSVRQELLEPLPNEEDVGYGAFSLVDLYRRQYGRTPSIDGVQPADLDTSTTLPRVEVISDRYVASETLTSIEVWILDPARGGVLDGLREGVRFDPGSTVTAFLNAEGQPEQIIVLA